MELADQRRDDMAVVGVVVVVRAVEVGGHHGEEFGAVLAVVAPAHLDAGDLGQGIGPVGRFERAGEQAVFLERLRGQPGVDAAGAEEQQAGGVVRVGGVDDVGLNGQVAADEVGRVGVVGVNTTHLGGGEEDVVGLLLGKEGVGGVFVGEVELGMGAGDEVAVAVGVQVGHQGRADQAAVAGDVDFGVEVHSAIGPVRPIRCSRRSGSHAS